MCRYRDSAAVGNLPADYSCINHVGGNEEGSQTDKTCAFICLLCKCNCHCRLWITELRINFNPSQMWSQDTAFTNTSDERSDSVQTEEIKPES